MNTIFTIILSILMIALIWAVIVLIVFDRWESSRYIRKNNKKVEEFILSESLCFEITDSANDFIKLKYEPQVSLMNLWKKDILISFCTLSHAIEIDYCDSQNKYYVKHIPNKVKEIILKRIKQLDSNVSSKEILSGDNLDFKPIGA